tara:strand:- start:1075 stop:1560 length:486 start_codon:yes stop_codon:yes gene_type:complete
MFVISYAFTVEPPRTTSRGSSSSSAPLASRPRVVFRRPLVAGVGAVALDSLLFPRVNLAALDCTTSSRAGDRGRFPPRRPRVAIVAGVGASTSGSVVASDVISASEAAALRRALLRVDDMARARGNERAREVEIDRTYYSSAFTSRPRARDVVCGEIARFD